MASYATKLEKFSRNKCCALCTGKVADEVSYGSIYKLGRIEVHYYCLLLSSIVVQKGEDEEGILGFLPNDILEAGKALSQVQCTYCGAKGANVRCAAARCRTVFHYPCGIQNGSFHRFSGRYPSYCSKHRSQQKIPRKIYDLIKAADIECVVCFEKVELDNTMIWAPCCQKSALFHRRCVQRLAISFGSYALKCPLCNNRKKFFDALVDNGIFIPEQDASWEADPEAFLDLLERHNRCDAFRCICMRGRDFSQNSYSSMWKIILCTDCGSQGIHRKCIRANIVPRTTLGWKCDVCRVLERVPSEQPTPAIDSYSISSDESDVEVISVQVASTSSSAPVPQLPIQSNPPSSSAPVPQLLIQSNPPSCSAPVPQLLIQSNPPSSSAPVPQFPIQSNLPESTASTVIKEETQQFDESEEENAQQLLLQLPASTSIQRRSLKRSRSPSPGPSQSDTNDERSHHEEKVFICNLDERSFDVAEVEVTTESSEVKEEPSTTTYCGVPLTYCDGPILITDSDDDAAANDTAISIYSDESDDYESDDDAVVEIPFRVDPDIEITVQGGSSRRLRSATARQPCPHQTMVCAHRVPATRSRTRLATSFN